MTPLLLLVVGGALAAVTRAAPEDCGLPKARGSCNQFAVRYYYDTEYGGCLRFWYGGCDGNGNRFATEAECERSCVEPSGDALCRLPAVRGACKRAHTRWYSDPASGGCRQFTYSGCLGNANRFETEAECQQRCGRVSPDSGTGGSGGGTGGVVPQPGPADCLLPDRVAGGCSEYVIRYSYVAARQQCAPFYYGGCGGNGNRFDSAETCRAACVKPPPTRPPYYAPPREREGQPGGTQTDYGRAERPDYGRTYYGREERPDYRRPDYGREERPDYRRPDYGREEQPEPTEAPAPITEPPQPAGDPCSLSADPGRCRAYMPSYYFNSARGGCERFIYGGCGGNDNRFISLAECEQRCGGAGRPSQGVEGRTSHGDDDSEHDMPHRGGDEREPYEVTDAPQPPALPDTAAPDTAPEIETEEPEVTEAPEPTTDICSQPADPGPCRGYEPNFYYSARLGQCTRFIYGGCGGNDNRFTSAAQCERQCGGGGGGGWGPEVQPTESPLPSTAEPTEQPDAYIPLSTGAEPPADVCQLPPTAGPCDQRLQRYYFNAALTMCFTFTYSGCGGNGNRFESAAECTARCRPGAAPEPTFAPFVPIDYNSIGGGVETTSSTADDYGRYDYSQYGGSIDTDTPFPDNYYENYADYADYEDYEYK